MAEKEEKVAWGGTKCNRTRWSSRCKKMVERGECPSPRCLSGVVAKAEPLKKEDVLLAEA